METSILPCGEEHLPAILEILNEAIVNTTALYDYHPRSMEMMRTWFDLKKRGNYPVIGLFNDQLELIGFGSYGPFRNFPAYKYTIEHSLYVHKNYRGKGFGKLLLNELIVNATLQQYHTMIGVIDASNLKSLGLHESLGFNRAGMLKQVGFKFSKWLDVVFVSWCFQHLKVPEVIKKRKLFFIIVYLLDLW